MAAQSRPNLWSNRSFMVRRKWFGGGDEGSAAAREGDPVREKSGAERREHLRVPVELEVRICFASSDDLVRSRTLNLSHGGAFVLVRDVRPIGTRARLVLVVGDRTLTIGGIVAHVVDSDVATAGGVGIFFTEIEATDRVLIDALVAAQAARLP